MICSATTLSVALPDGRSIEYDVDGAGRRVGRRVFSTSGTELEFRGWIYRDLLRPIAEVDALGNVVARYVYADGEGAKQNGVSQLETRLGANQDTRLPFSGDNVPELIQLLSNGAVTKTLRLIKNQVGTVGLVTDAATGEVLQRMEHDEFGRVLLDTNPGMQPFGFAGGLFDAETGLVRFGARDYDPRVGRWTARDPVRAKGGANHYLFAVGAPVVRGDPAGLKPGKWDIFGWLCDAVTFGNCPIPTGIDDFIWDPTDPDQYKKNNDNVVACLNIRAAGYDCCQGAPGSSPYACKRNCDPTVESCANEDQCIGEGE